MIYLLANAQRVRAINFWRRKQTIKMSHNSGQEIFQLDVELNLKLINFSLRNDWG